MDKVKILQKLIPDEADAVIISSQKNIYYISSFNFSDGFILITRKNSYLFTDSRYIEAAKNRLSSYWTIIYTGNRKDILEEIYSENRIKTVCFEDNVITCSSFNKMKEDFSSITFIPLGNIINNMREYKDAGEITNIIRAQKIAEEAFSHILNTITYNMTEVEVALELEYNMRKNGSSGLAFDIIAVSGTASALPHGEPRPQKLEKGFLTLDFGAVVNGYKSDMTRTICIGKADSELKHLYNTVLRAQEMAIEAAFVGVECSLLDKIARDYIYKEGYEGKFGHGLGHGVGLDIHEAPSISLSGKDKTLKAGHVITIEPGIYLEGKYGARIEDMLVAGECGITDITNSPKHLIEI